MKQIIWLCLWGLGAFGLVGCSTVPEPTFEPVIEPKTEVEVTEVVAELPTMVPTAVLPTTTPPQIVTPDVSDLLIISRDRPSNTADECHNDVSMIDTSKPSKTILFSGLFSTLIWGPEGTDSIFISSHYNDCSGNTWQMYQVNYLTGEVQSFWKEPIFERVPHYVDSSVNGKWLRFSAPTLLESYSYLFVNTHDKSITHKNDLFGEFVWSPLDDDLFAYFDTEDTTNGHDVLTAPQNNWGSEPEMIWSSSMPNTIQFYILNNLYEVDLKGKQWLLVTDNIWLYTYTADPQLSPSGRWLISSPAFVIEVASMGDLQARPFKLIRTLKKSHQLVGWYDGQDIPIIATEDGEIVLYELIDGMSEVTRVDLAEWAIVADDRTLFNHGVLVKKNH